MELTVPVVAGSVSTALFALSALPMLWKARHTKDLRSYSLGNLATANVANLVHSLYIFNLPAGPIWFLHGFYLVSTGLMLTFYLRYRSRGRDEHEGSQGGSWRLILHW